MSLPSRDSYERPFIGPTDEPLNPLGTGLPNAWWPSVGGTVSLVFSIFWMMESWKDAASLYGPTKVNHLSQDLAGLLATLVCAYGTYRFWKHRSESLGIVLGLLVAAAAMTWHRA